jgi:hypothetical protein
MVNLRKKIQSFINRIKSKELNDEERARRASQSQKGEQGERSSVEGRKSASEIKSQVKTSKVVQRKVKSEIGKQNISKKTPEAENPYRVHSIMFRGAHCD